MGSEGSGSRIPDHNRPPPFHAPHPTRHTPYHSLMHWRVLLTPPLPGADNMALDEALLERARQTGEAVARVYTGRLLASIIAHQVNNLLPGIVLMLGLLGAVPMT